MDKSCCKKNWLLFIFSIVKLNGTRTINFPLELIVWRHPLVYVQVNKYRYNCSATLCVEMLNFLSSQSSLSFFKFHLFSLYFARASFKRSAWARFTQHKSVPVSRVSLTPEFQRNLSKGVKGNYVINQTHRIFFSTICNTRNIWESSR